MKPTSLVTAIPLIVWSAVASLTHADDGIRRETVKFARGASSAQARSNPQNYFNVLPPGSNDVAMVAGDAGGDLYQGLPTPSCPVAEVGARAPATG